MKTYDQVKETHLLYCKLTGLNLPLQMNQLWAWEKFCLRFTDDDLRLVIRFIRDKLRDRKPARSFTFRNFIAGPNSLDFFDEDLQEARARYKFKPIDSGKVSVLKASGRAVPEQRTVMPVVQVMEQHALMSQMLKGFAETL